ncbi:PAS domain-containing protein [Aquamicrobium sp. LC103]|uniref:PAS domain-containing protein n=1 Tax=Aquamicrobium sp. LC103 TaxID=1120658 RepID=UPI00063E8B6D|nr:PAS domain-containing protein [Aquamicrobium sp. LC103]TKT79191.1 PAS domain-containing protein [Aquamicrobium sp. LC103]
MNQDGSIALFRYWDTLRDGRPAPRRTEIEPAEIKSLLADTFILEKDTRGEAIFRLAGTRLCATYGRELKGYAFPLIWSTRDQRMIARLAFSVFQEKAVVVVTFAGASRGDNTLSFEMILLPLEGGLGSPRLLGAITPASKPFWLGADPIVENRIDTLRVVDPEREQVFLGSRASIKVPSIAPGAGSMLRDGGAPGEGGRRIRHLIVFDGGREG